MLIIETERLLIRPLRTGDAPAVQVAKEEAWPELQMWMNWAYDDMKPLAALKDYIASRPPDNLWDAAIAFDRRDGGFAVMSGVHDKVEGGRFSTGYWAARAKRGMGYASETTNALIRYAFAHLGAQSVDICYYEGNTASRRVIDKLGFAYTHTVKGGHNRCSDGTPLDVHHFVMTDPSVLPPLAWRMVEEA